MMKLNSFNRNSIRRRILAFCALFAFSLNTLVFPVQRVYAQEALGLPTPGVRIGVSPEFAPPVLKGIKVYPSNPFRFDFILDKGDSNEANDRLKDEASQLIKYFLASLTVPEKDLWVNLSPYEKDRIVPEAFGLTEMGRDLLEQDYLLKQITASIIYPEDATGKKFWKRVYAKAYEKYGTTDVPVDTFNKVWIVPEKAVVYENAQAGTAYVVDSHLKVMLESDYLALEKNANRAGVTYSESQNKETQELAKNVIREIVIPELEREVNEGKNFIKLRQVYQSLILATWFKKKITGSVLGKVYIDQKKVAGVNVDNPDVSKEIWTQYVKAFKKGVYNYIKEEEDPVTKEVTPRKYFSGGASFYGLGSVLGSTTDGAMVVSPRASFNLQVQIAPSVGSHHRVKNDLGGAEGSFEVLAQGGIWSVRTKDQLNVVKLQQAIDQYLERHPNAKSLIDPAKLKFEVVGGPRLGNTVHDRDRNPTTIQIHRNALQQDVERGLTEIPAMTLAALEDEFTHFEISALLKEKGIDNVVVEEALVILSRLLDELADSLRSEGRSSPYSVDWLSTTYSGEMGNSLSEILNGIRGMLAGGKMPNILSLLSTLDKVIQDIFRFVEQSYTTEGYEEYGNIFRKYHEQPKQQKKAEQEVKSVFIQMFLSRSAELMGLLANKPSGGMQKTNSTDVVLTETKAIAEQDSSKEEMALQQLARSKKETLVREGQEAFLVGQLVDKQIIHAQKQAVILIRSLKHREYLKSFIDALAEIDRMATFFGISRQAFSELLGLNLSEQDLYVRYRTYLEWFESLPKDDPIYQEISNKMGQLPGSAAISETTFSRFLEANIEAVKNKRPDVRKRTADLLKDKTGNDLVAEVFRYYDFFLYSEDFSLDFYEQLQVLVKAAGLSLDEVVSQRQSHSSESERYFLSQIQQRRQVTYAEFMQMALYDPQYGFYMRERTGDVVGSKKNGKGEFETLPERFTEFGKGVALDLFNRWKALGSPQEFQVVEMGAGQGTMARDIMRTVKEIKDGSPEWQQFAAAIKYKIVEISPTLIAKQQERLGELARHVEWVQASAADIKAHFAENSVTGVFLSNELPDAFPVHKVRMVGGDLKEIFISVENGVFVETENELSTEGLREFLEINHIQLVEGESRVINLQALSWIDGMNSILKEGFIMTFDYGHGGSLNQVMLNLQPQFRKYGRERNKQQIAYFGVTGEGTPLDEFAILTKLMAEGVGQEKMLEAIADKMKNAEGGRSLRGELSDLAGELLGSHPFREMERVLRDYVANPLPQAGNVDITTDADFPSMERRARALGLKGVFFDTQRSYFEKLSYFDVSSRKSMDPEFLESASRYKVQIFHKTSAVDLKKASLADVYADLLGRGRIETVEDVGVLFDFLEEVDPLGLGQVAKAVRNYAVEKGRPLAGISSDSVVRFLERGSGVNRFIADHQNNFAGEINIANGTPLAVLIGELIEFVPYNVLPNEYQEYMKTIPEIREGMFFDELNDAVFDRLVKSRVLRSHVEAAVAVALYDMGHENSIGDSGIEQVRNLVANGPMALEEKARTMEPMRTQYQINALRIAVSLTQNKAEIGKPIEFQDLFVFGDGRYHFNQNALMEIVGQVWMQATGEGAIKLLTKLATSMPIQNLAEIRGLFAGQQVDSKKFFEIKEMILSHFIRILASRIDKDKEKRQPVVVEADLGPRIVPEDRGNAGRINRQAEDSRNLIALFGKYAAYVDHLLRVDSERARQEHLLSLIRVLDPERDVKLLNILLSQVKQSRYESEKGDFELAKTLYEKGFKEKAREVFKSWGTSSYRWSPEAVTFLAKNGEREILDPYLSSHREDLSVDRQYFYSDFTPLSFSLTNDEEADQLFDQEWAYIKDLLRVFIVASEKEYYPDKIGEWWKSNKSRIKLGGQPFDVFSPERERKYSPGVFKDLNPAGKWMIHPIRFIERALEDPRFRAKAIALIGEFDDSPMKLKLYEKAADNLPQEWGLPQVKAFFEIWSKTLRAVSEQAVQHDFMEPTGDFRQWPRSYRDEDIPKVRKIMPKSYAGTKLFHYGVQKMVEVALGLVSERNGFGDMRNVAEGLLSGLEHGSERTFSFRTWYEEYRWAHDPFFYSGNQYASLWAYVRSRQGAVDVKGFRKMLKQVSVPDRKQYGWELLAGSHDEIVPAYICDVKLYVENMKNIYNLALKRGFNEEARQIYESVHNVILDVAKEMESGYSNNKEKAIMTELQNYWAVQEILQELLARDGKNGEAAIFERLAQRIGQDSRGFFSVDSIAETAKALSRREEYAPFAVRLFKMAIDKLAPKRGESDWLSKGVREAIKESGLSDRQKDETYHYALTQMWPQEDYPLTKFFGMYDDANELEILIREIFSNEEKFPRARSFLLEKMARGVDKMDPLKYGKKLEGEYVSTFYWELKTLAFLVGNFTDRKELLEPENYESLKGLYRSESDALDALESLFPEQVKQDRSKAKHTELPKIAEVEKGIFVAQDLERQLTGLLEPGQPDKVWQEAFGVLGAWLRHDVLDVINQRLKEEEAKKYDEKKEVVIGEADLNEKASYQMAWRLASPHFAAQEQSPFAQQAIATLFDAKTEKEATAKAFIAYRVLKSDSAMLSVQRRAFEMLVKSQYLPGYVGHVYDQRIKNASEDRQREFFGDVALWDHMTPSRERPYALWAHLFEVDGEKRAKLRERIKRYRVDEKNWKPDLQEEGDWWILQHEFKKGWRSVGFEQYLAVWSYQKFLKGMSLTDRVISLMGERDRERVNIEFLIDNWDRIEGLEAQDVDASKTFLKSAFLNIDYAKNKSLNPLSTGIFEDVSATEVRLKQGIATERLREMTHTYDIWDILGDTIVAREHFEKIKGMFVGFKEAIRNGTEPELDRWEMVCVFELLKTRNSIQPKESLGLKALLQVRFTSLGNEEIDALYNLAVNPFLTVEDARRENGKTVGESKDWWSQTGYRYQGERIWHKALIAATKNKLSAQEQDALVAFMYPFSKTNYYSHFYRLNEMFPYDVPEKSFGYEKKAEAEAANLLMPVFASYSLDELGGIAKRIPVYARTHLARKHQMELYKVELPENFKDYHEFAVFLMKTYLGMLKIGALEEISKELKDKKPDDALHQLFVLRDMIKLGQLLASRPEVPDHYHKVLSDLLDKVAPSDVEEVRNAIQSQLEWKTGDYTLVKNLNAGSMGEVWLVDHKDYPVRLAVKVLTPSKEKKIKEVLKEMKDLREILDWYRDISKESAMAYEVRGKLINLIESELDFRKDKENWEQMFGFDQQNPDQRNIKEDGTIPVPGTKFYTAMYFEVKEKTLVMSYVDGVNINDPTDGIKEEPQRKVLAGELSDYLKEKIFASANGVYPSDLHSGNILKTRTTNKIVLIDTGQVGRITPVARERVMKFLLLLAIGDVQGTAEALQQMKNPSREESIDQEGLVSKITELMGEAGEPIERVRDLFAHAPFYGLFIDPVYMDLLKGIMTFQGTALSLDPQFTFVSMDAAQTADHAQNEVLKQDGTIGKKGGIDFNPEEMHLQVQNNGGAIKFNLDPSMIQQLQNAPGFSPIIIDMQPLNSVQMFLGLNDSADKMAAVH